MFLALAALLLSLILGQHVLFAAISRYVVDAGALDQANNVIRKDTLDLGRVHTRLVALEALVPGHPALGGVCDSDEAFKDLRGTVVDLLRVAGELKKLFAVGAALRQELLLGADNGADHAGAHVALLVGGDVRAASHVFVGVGVSVVGCAICGRAAWASMLTLTAACIR